MASETPPDPPGNIYTVIADAGARRDQVKLVHNEQTKLSATALNGVAVALVIGGGVAPLLGVASAPISENQFILSVIWIVAAFIIHSLARLILRSLR